MEKIGRTERVWAERLKQTLNGGYVVTYLAMEISLYLASAALMGLCLGWLVWGRGRVRQLAKIESEMSAALDAERKIAKQARRELDDADGKRERALESEKARSTQAVAEVRQLLDAEKEAAHQSRMEISQLRLSMEEAIQAEKASAADAVGEAMTVADRERLAATEALSRENHSRAELEELRLTAGAEKLAAQSARAELQQMKTTLQGALDAERDAGQQARRALDDIGETLRRTFRDDILSQGPLSDLPSFTAPVAPTIIETIALPRDKTAPRIAAGQTGFARPAAFDPPQAPPVGDEGLAEETTVFAPIASANGDKAEAGDNVVPEHENPADDRPAVQDQDSEAAQPTLLVHPVATRDYQRVSSDMVNEPRPGSFYDQRPLNVDMLQMISGIDPAMETLLNEQGCYQFEQIAHFSTEDIDWLARRMAIMPDLKLRIERDSWVEQARDLQDKKHGQRPRWWNRRRLQ